MATVVLVCFVSFVWAHFSYSALEKLVRQQNEEQRDLMAQLSESWRADSERRHREAIDAMKAMAVQEKAPFNVQGHLAEFNRALSTEVRVLLGEVGRIREERRALQNEIADLLSMKAKYDPEGKHEAKRKPPGPAPPPPPADKTPSSVPGTPDIPPPVKPIWHNVRPPREDAGLKGKLAKSWEMWHPTPEHHDWVSLPPVPLVSPAPLTPTILGLDNSGIFTPSSRASSCDPNDFSTLLDHLR